MKIWCWEIYLDPRGMKMQRSGRDGTLRTFVIHTPWQCYSGNHIKKNICVGMWRERVEARTCFGGETWGKEPIEIPRYWWKNNIKWVCKKCLELGRVWSFFMDGDLCQAVVKTIVNHWVAWKVCNCFTNWGTVRLSGRNLHRWFRGYFV